MSVSGRHKRLYAALAFVYMLPYIQSVGMGVISSDLMADLRLSPNEMGVLGSSYLYAYAVVQLCSGLIAARFGPRLTLSLLFSVTTAGCLIVASASSLGMACLGRMLCGAGMAATLTGALTVFGRWFPPAVYGRITAWFFSIGGMGSFLATAPLSALNSAVGWQTTFAGLGLTTGLCALLMFVIVRDWPPAEHAPPCLPGSVPANVPASLKDGPMDCVAGRLATHLSASPAERSHDEREDDAREKETPSFGLLWSGLKQAASRRDFWKLCAWYAFMSGTFYAFGGLWAGPYLTDVYGFSKTQVGGILSMGAVGFVVGNPLLTWICENRLRSYRLGMGWACVLGFAGVCLLVFKTDSMSMPTLYVMALALGMAANAPNAAGYAAARNLFGVRLAGAIGGILGFSSFIGGACLQVLCGVILSAAVSGGAATGTAYALAFAPFFLCAAVGAWGAFTMTEGFGR